jgi:prepilin-type N-terminal cleavage/methylation domain-containing protein
LDQPQAHGWRLDARRQHGFTLIDLMICVAVIGVLSTVAYPAFSSTVSKSRRSDALVALMKQARAFGVGELGIVEAFGVGGRALPAGPSARRRCVRTGAPCRWEHLL